MSRMNRRAIILGLLLLVLLVIWISLRVDLREWTMRAYVWIKELGPMGPLLFVTIYMIMVILVLPTAFLTLAAGLLYGVFWGSVFVITGISIGAVGAFLIGRYGFSDAFSHYIRNHPKLQAVDTELVHEGFKIVLLTRLTPLFPGKLSNYFFGVAQFGLRDFFWGTTIGIIPLTFLNVYVGSLAGNLAALGPDAVARSPVAWIAAVVGVAGAALLLQYLARLTRHALQSSISPREP